MSSSVPKGKETLGRGGGKGLPASEMGWGGCGGVLPTGMAVPFLAEAEPPLKLDPPWKAYSANLIVIEVNS